MELTNIKQTNNKTKIKMKTSKVYSSIIIAKLVMFFSRIKSKLLGSHYAQETYSLKFDRINDEYIVEHYTMTRVEEQQFHEAIARKQQEIIEMAEETKYQMETVSEAPKMTAKPKQKTKPKAKKADTNVNTEKVMEDIKNRGVYNGEVTPKKKYYHNKNKSSKAKKVQQ